MRSDEKENLVCLFLGRPTNPLRNGAPLMDAKWKKEREKEKEGKQLRLADAATAVANLSLCRQLNTHTETK